MFVIKLSKKEYDHQGVAEAKARNTFWERGYSGDLRLITANSESNQDHYDHDNFWYFVGW